MRPLYLRSGPMPSSREESQNRKSAGPFPSFASNGSNIISAMSCLLAPSCETSRKQRLLGRSWVLILPANKEKTRFERAAARSVTTHLHVFFHGLSSAQLTRHWNLPFHLTVNLRAQQTRHPLTVAPTRQAITSSPHHLYKYSRSRTLPTKPPTQTQARPNTHHS